MDNLAAIASVFGIAFFSLWASIPAGLALGLSGIIVALTAGVSYAAGVLLVLVAGEPLRRWLLKRLGGHLPTDNPNSRVGRILARYGLIGLSLIAPITLGAQIGTVVGLSLGFPPRRLFLGMALGGLLWAVGLTVAIGLGVAGLNAA